MERLGCESRRTGGKWEFLTATWSWSISLERAQGFSEQENKPFVT